MRRRTKVLIAAGAVAGVIALASPGAIERLAAPDFSGVGEAALMFAKAVDQSGKVASTVGKAVEPIGQLRLSPSASDDGVFRDCQECPEMVLLPAGSFMMGSGLGEDVQDASGFSRRRVDVSKPFAVSKHEITRGEFRSYVEAAAPNMAGGCEHFNMQDGVSRGDNKRSWKNPGYAQAGDHPVACVNWHDAKAYVEWLSRRTGEKYRLLSEAEWEYAARGAATEPFRPGTAVQQQEHANYGGYRRGTVEVGSFPPNAVGLHDVLGNVHEWVEDRRQDADNRLPLDEPTVGDDHDCPERMILGGSWRSFAYTDNILSEFRSSSCAGIRSTDVGFRVARAVAFSPDCPDGQVEAGSGCLQVPEGRQKEISFVTPADSQVSRRADLLAASNRGEWETVSCFSGVQQRAVSLGNFTSRGAGGRTRLILSNNEDEGCMILHESGGEPATILDDSASFEAICHDPASGLDHAVMLTAAGNIYSSIGIWAVDTATGTPKAIYNEAWRSDGRLGDVEGWGLDLLVAADGTCLWRERQAARETVDAGMSALRIGEKFHIETETATALRSRAVPAAIAHKWLRYLEASGARLEGAVYANDVGKESWRVIQVLGTTVCDAEGVVLVLDRRNRSWRTIYDVPSGCSKELNFPMRGMTVKGSRLFASICSGTCDGLGDYQDFIIELDTDLATPLDGGTVRQVRIEWEEMTGTVGLLVDENPPIRDVDTEVFPK